MTGFRGCRDNGLVCCLEPMCLLSVQSDLAHKEKMKADAKALKDAASKLKGGKK